MKILHVCRYFQPQLGYQEYFLTRAHVEAGHEVLVLTSDRYFPFPDYENTVKPVLGERICGAGESDYDGIHIKRLKTVLELKTSFMWLCGLEREIRRFAPDYVICHGVGGITELRVARLRRKLKFNLVYDDHTHLSQVRTGLIGKIYYKIYPFSYLEKNADRIIGIAQECLTFLTDYCHFTDQKLEMISLGANAERFQFSQAQRDEFRKEHGIADKEVVILYTGKLISCKNPYAILDALRVLKDRIRERQIPVTAVFVGNGEKEYVAGYRNVIEEVSQWARIIQIPALPNEELPKIYTSADIAVWPRQASMGMIEAMACRCAIICCDFLAERCKYDNGLLIKEDDINSLAEALWSLISDPELCHKMGEAGRHYVDQELSWKAVAQKFIDVVKE